MSRSYHLARALFFVLAASFNLHGCTDDTLHYVPDTPIEEEEPKETDPPTAPSIDNQLHILIEQHGLTGDPAAGLPPVVTPDEDPKVKLGQMLFFNHALSLDYDTSCATCHQPRLGSGDNLSLSVGVSAKYKEVMGLHRSVYSDHSPFADGGPDVPRNSPPIYNAALYKQAMFWDGRVYSVGEDEDGVMQIRTPENARFPDPNAGGNLLQAQARFPVTSNDEMRGFNHGYLPTGADVREYIASRFRGTENVEVNYYPQDDIHMSEEERENWHQMFRAAFGDQDLFTLITYNRIQEAIAAYESQWIYVNTPWNAYVQGDKNAISDDAKQGASLFFSSIESGGLGCAGCHSGDTFTDEKYYNIAFPQFGYGHRADRNDLGRYAVVQEPENKYAYRTPSLLNVMDTGPWGHVGGFDNIEKLLRYHSDPLAHVFKYSIADITQLEQFRFNPLTDWGKNGYQGTLNAMFLATEATSFTDVAKPMLPNRALSSEEVQQLTAFLQTLSDPAVTQYNTNATCNDNHASPCPEVWIPTPDDPRADSNTLFGWFDSDTPPNAPPIAPPIEDPVDYPDSIALNLFFDPTRTNFEDAENCTVNLHPEQPNNGTLAFVEQAQNLGLASAVHGYTGATWFLKSGDWTELLMQSGGLSVAYLNDDCWPDLVFSGGDTSGLLTFINNGDGSGFTETALIDTTGIETGRTGDILPVDLNGDFQRELVIGNILPGNVAILEWNETSQQYQLAANLPMGRNTFSLSAGDINNDGYPELLLAHWAGMGLPGSAPILFVNDGGEHAVASDSDWGIGTGDGMSQTFNFTPALADLNGDGKQDLLVASDFLTSWMGHNNGSKFIDDDPYHDTLIDNNGMGQALGDFDNNGLLDWFVSSIYDPLKHIHHPDGNWGITGNQLYKNITPQENNAPIQFANATDEAGVADAGWGWGVCAADFNNDGWLDLFVENGWGFLPKVAEDLYGRSSFYAKLASGLFNTKPKLFINNGDGTFTDRSDEMNFKPSNGRGVVCFDYDHDGDIDIGVHNNSGPLLFYTNTRGSGPNRNFLNIRLVGDAPNTDALGAIVRVTATIKGKTVTQMRAVNQNSNYLSHNPTNLHFGLGNATTAKVEVQWPDGTIHTYNENAGQFVVYQQ